MHKINYLKVLTNKQDTNKRKVFLKVVTSSHIRFGVQYIQK